MAIDRAQPLDHEHAGARAEPEGVGDVVVWAREPRSEEARRHVLAFGREVACEAAELEDVVVDRRRRHERPEAVAPRDQVLALEQLERLAQGHERHAEALGEAALVVEPGAGTERALADPRAQRSGDLVVAGEAAVHSSVLVHSDLVHRRGPRRPPPRPPPWLDCGGKGAAPTRGTPTCLLVVGYLFRGLEPPPSKPNAEAAVQEGK